ncbi:hypothetical protein [uncultured Hymenobacter sp.]|uniref:hypothetical protein n=1 Tax=uncultured Hymenobacter sp. TaxID=170016 RepID=UPI0035CC52EE
MMATLFLLGTLAGTDCYVVLFLLLGLLLGFCRRFARTGQLAPSVATSRGERPEPESELIPFSEYKAQKHRLLHS